MVKPTDWCGEFAVIGQVAPQAGSETPEVGLSVVGEIATQLDTAGTALLKAAGYLKDDKRPFRAQEAYKAGLIAKEQAEALRHG